jgi:hypothetical protein
MAQREKRGRAGATARHWRTGPANQREREGANGRRKLAPTGWSHWAARERGRVGAQGCADRWGSPVRQRGRTGALAGWLNGLPWAKLAFPIFLEFLMPFLFILSRVFNSNSN